MTRVQKTTPFVDIKGTHARALEEGDRGKGVSRDDEWWRGQWRERVSIRREGGGTRQKVKG